MWLTVGEESVYDSLIELEGEVIKAPGGALFNSLLSALRASKLETLKLAIYEIEDPGKNLVLDEYGNIFSTVPLKVLRKVLTTGIRNLMEEFPPIALTTPEDLELAKERLQEFGQDLTLEEELYVLTLQILVNRAEAPKRIEAALSMIESYQEHIQRSGSIDAVLTHLSLRWPEDGGVEKVMRWLGFIQGACYALGLVSLEDLRKHTEHRFPKKDENNGRE